MEVHEPTMSWSDDAYIDYAWSNAEMRDFERQSKARRQKLARWWVRRIVWNLKARNR
jgi:hypothetical protein